MNREVMQEGVEGPQPDLQPKPDLVPPPLAVAESPASEASKAGHSQKGGLSEVRGSIGTLEQQLREQRIREAQLVEQNLDPGFLHNEYTFRKQSWLTRLPLGGDFDVFDREGNRVLYAHQDRGKMKEKFHLYNRRGDDKKELLLFDTEQRVDAWSRFDVADQTTGEPIGSIKREAMRSVGLDSWTIRSPEGLVIGQVAEKGWKRATLSRMLPRYFAAQHYAITAPDGTEVAEIKQSKKPLTTKYFMTINEQHPQIDRRLLVTTGILLAGVEANIGEGGTPASDTGEAGLGYAIGKGIEQALRQ